MPQLRHIEDFLGALKQDVYKDGWEAQDEQQLKQRVRKFLKEFDWIIVQSMMMLVKTNSREVADTAVSPK